MKLPFIQVEKSKNEVIMIPVDKILPNPYQPRSNFDQNDLKELAESINNYGVIQPIIIKNKDQGYELIAGERRLRASKSLGLKNIPAIIKEFSEQEIAEIALVENLQRKDLNFLEEAEAYHQILQQFELTQKELAKKLGKSQSTIANKLRLLNLPTDVRKQLNSPFISERHARALLKLTEINKQLMIIEKIKKKNLTVKETEGLINKILQQERKDKKVIVVYKDLRLFTNSLKKTIKEMKTAGLDVKVDTREDDNFVEYKIRLPKNR